MDATPFLMFQGDASAAIALWQRAFPDQLEVLETTLYGPGDFEGKVAMARVRLGSSEWLLNDSIVPHAFTFTPSTSFFVDFDEPEPLRHALDVLSEGGEVRMPLDDHGFSRLYAWITDAHGVSWQLNLPFAQ